MIRLTKFKYKKMEGMDQKRLYYHLSHENDVEIINKMKSRYDLLSNERKEQVKKYVVSTADCCGGRPRLDNHRLIIELVMCDYLNGENCYEINDYTMDDLGVKNDNLLSVKKDNKLSDICAVWFFETWMNSEYYKMT